ncbi:MAG: hypothetical protein P4L55_08355 [Syntrophobacteraceae bacterium]|nr:hypothetical protein [Syntrophobacteraceae bacterium]
MKLASLKVTHATNDGLHPLCNSHPKSGLQRCFSTGPPTCARCKKMIEARGGKEPGKRRHLKYLQARDVFPGLTFHKFLTDPFFAEARQSVSRRLRVPDAP